ncbi:DUF6118 family protein [Sphingomonas sp. OK281]|uniref:DUF6118 family protein n=1 Tax=Sphingomonas sp. OK281 TaxID=1881067 RepID=UPI0008F2ADE0|nr:DUF6118 family protein [Sphingomonas sp. OK281]SFO33474.1 hypothetical protein SAMN05428984_3440 [Sphingomonas sp. OK281]
MDQIGSPNEPENDAATAFGEVRAEISLLRRAVERLTDERTAQPDYAPSLEAIAKRLEDVCVWAKRVSERPALGLTPANLARQIAEAGETVRTRDRDMLDRAGRRMDDAGSRIDAIIARARSAAEQDRELNRNRIAFGVAGMVLWAILPGAVARSLPVGWAVPERIAARMLGTDMWQAGQNMMFKADPARWSRIVSHERQRAMQVSQPGREAVFVARP